MPVSSVLIEDWLAELIRNEQPRLARLQIDGVQNAAVGRKTEKIRLSRSLMLENDSFGLFRILADLDQINGARGSTAANGGNRQYEYLRRATIRRARLEIITGVVRIILTRSVLPIDLRFVAHHILIEICASRRGLFGLAFTMVGLRLLILYFEAIGGLTATGLGLIGGGVLCLVLTWLGWRLTQRLARTSIP